MGKLEGQKLHKRPDTPFELYDLHNDPGETTDVAAAHPDVIARIQDICAESHKNSELFPFPALDRIADDADHRQSADGL